MMADYSVIDLRCPSCGANISSKASICDHCGREIIVSSFSSVYALSDQEFTKFTNFYKNQLKQDSKNPNLYYSIALCYLKIKLYNKALINFEKAIDENFDNPDAYYYASICLLRGKKAFLSSITDIRKAEEYINAALMIENKGIYNYLLSYIKFDFYHRKSLNVEPDYIYELNKSKSLFISQKDVQDLFAILGVLLPEELKIF